MCSYLSVVDQVVLVVVEREEKVQHEVDEEHRVDHSVEHRPRDVLVVGEGDADGRRNAHKQQQAASVAGSEAYTAISRSQCVLNLSSGRIMK